MTKRSKHAGKSAQKAGLQYCTDKVPGIYRKSSGKAVYYVDAKGKRIRDRATLARIRSLVIPPAWKKVWIAPRPNQHLQATGHDAKGRKQYRYHPRWRECRDQAKYNNLIAFAKVLPRIRRKVRQHLKRSGLPREKVLAAIVRLLETSLIRVGNEEYVRENHSFGLTTMKDRHVNVKGENIAFHFRGKSGIDHEIDLQSATLARIVKRCQELPGQDLFQYLDNEGRVHDVKSTDVNEYLQDIAGRDVTAKDFRTWAGTSLAAQALKEFEEFDSQARAKRNITRAIERVTSRLGNTVSVCRKCYVHPAIIDAYMDHSLLKLLQQRTENELRKGLTALKPEEAAVLALLQERMKRKLGPSSAAGR